MEFTLKLHHPLTDEEWDTITDADLDHTASMTFKTKHGKEVTFVPEKKGKWNTEHDLDEKMLACSSCGGRVFAKEYGYAVGTNGYRYCPYCGARMEP